MSGYAIDSFSQVEADSTDDSDAVDLVVAYQKTLWFTGSPEEMRLRAQISFAEIESSSVLTMQD